MSKEKRISLETLEREYNSTRKYHSATLKNGEVIRYYAKFSETKIEKLLQELYEMVLIDEKLEEPLFDEDGKLIKFSYFLVIKYFTDLGKSFPDGYENSLLLFNKMIELDLFSEIINDVLPIEESGKVYERIIEKYQLVDNMLANQRAVEELAELKAQERELQLLQEKK